MGDFPHGRLTNTTREAEDMARLVLVSESERFRSMEMQQRGPLRNTGVAARLEELSAELLE